MCELSTSGLVKGSLIINTYTGTMNYRLEAKTYILTSIFIAVLIVCFQSCYYDSEEYLFPELDSDCDTTDISYSGAVAPIISQSCLACHGNIPVGTSIKLEEYSDLKTSVDNGSLIGSITHGSGYSPMPQGANKLDDCSISLIQLWIDSGASNN